MGQFSVEKPVAPGSVLSGNQQSGHGSHRRISERDQLLLLPLGLLLGPSDGGDDSRDRNFLKSLPLQVPAERQLWVACSDRPDSPATSKFAIRNDRLTSISCRPLSLRPAGTELPRRLSAIGVQMQRAIDRRMPRRRHPKFVPEHVHASR